ncbi:MAG TPA: protein kinase [Polyangiales bacterium]|nr:protein kinase [Polyangiales bacterium]
MTLDSARPNTQDIELRAASLATERFQLVRKLGAGGMATVYEVLDRSTGRRLALKRLHGSEDEKRRRRVLELFEREFHTLSQIKHPRVVEAYDYGVDDQGAYYTMELLEGYELQLLAPLPLAAVCRIGREVCSALSLLHSRRLVYRDLNPRNVHCLGDGSIKLIDFGATTNMGPSRQVVGTPAFCAPEALDLQPLDARTDLYSVGATLYFALTGRHAYPAKTFAQLRDFWSLRPSRPSELIAGVPPALDSLLMDLLALDPSARPANAAEVMEQLAAIEGRPGDEQQQVTQAYLSTPNLIGRDAPLARVRAKLLRTLRGYGSALIFEGGSGVGRTRLLAACLLEAKLLGALVLRADATDSEDDYGVARALGLSLCETAPEQAHRSAEPKLSLLGHVLPELLRDKPEIALQLFDDPNRQRSQVLSALREWFLSIARERPLMLAIDDLHEVDEPSAALLALCAHEAAKYPLAVIVTREAEARVRAPSALKLFEGAAASVQLSNLSARHTEDLLRSVFGDVPHIQAVAHKLHQISQGNPRDTLQLAQYLVDRNVAHYRSGAWTLPPSFDEGDLPSNMAQALRVQIEMLSPRARELACLVSLAADRELAGAECAALYPDLPAKEVHDSLDELIAAQVLERSADSFTVSHRGISTALRQDLSDADRRRLHHALAELFARRGNEEFRRALHLFRAGEAAAGLDVLVPYALNSQATTDNRPLEYLKLVESMPDNWFEVYARAIAMCDELSRPVAQAFALRNRLAGLVNVMGAPSTLSHPQLLALLGQLARDSGLTDYAELERNGSERSSRLQRALGLARERHAASSEQTRGLDPLLALKHLVRSQIACVGMAAVALDYEFWAQLPSLTPFSPLSPAVALMDLLVAGVGSRLAGRHERACALYVQVIERTDQPDHAGLDDANWRFMRYGVMCALGIMEAGMGLPSSLQWADQVESEPLHQVNAYQIRILFQLWQGRVRDADRLRERVELLRLESSPRQLADGLHLVMQIVAHALSDDLTRVKHTLDEIRTFAHRHPSWNHVVQYASGEYQRIRGDHASAALQLKAALAEISAGTHQIWPFAAGAYAHVLCLLGRASEASEIAEQALRAAEQAELGYMAHYIRMPLAQALAEQGQCERAAGIADAVIENLRALRCDGLSLVLAYETRTRVAIRAKDRAAYEIFARLCAEQCRAAGSRVLGAKYERLVRAATSASVHVPDATPAHILATLTGTQLTSVLVGCNKPSERAERTLQLLIRRSGASAGFLYLIGDHGPELVAQGGPNEPPLGLPGIVSEFIDRELHDREMNTRSLEAEEAPSTWPVEEREAHHLVLLSHQMSEGFAVTGCAALVIEPGAPFVHPGSLASHLSRLTFDAGDVTPILG